MADTSTKTDDTAKVVSSLTDREIKALCAPIRHIAKRNRALFRLGLALLFLCVLNIYRSLFDQAILIIALFLLFSLCEGLYLMLRVGFDRRKERVIALLIERSEVRAIPFLLEAQGEMNSAQDELMRKALLILLSEIKETDNHLLNGKQRSLLRGLLKSNDVGLILAVLKALEKIGDIRDTAAVRRLADGKDVADLQKDIQRAARFCIPILEANHARRTADSTLLRPASDTGREAENLLRPASETTGGDPAKLLRSVETGEIGTE